MSSSIPEQMDFFKSLKEFAEGEQYDEFTLKRFKREAKKLLKVDAAHGYMALGIISSTERDPETVRTNFRRAMKLLPNNTTILVNYSTALGFLGFFSEAADLVLQAYGLAPRNSGILSNAIAYCHMAGRFHKTRQLIDMWHKIKPERLHKRFLHVQDVVRFMDDRDVKDKELEQLVGLTMTVLHGHKIYVRPQRIRTYISENEERYHFYYWVAVLRPLSQVNALNTELTHKVRDAFPDDTIRGEFIPLYEAIAL